MDGERATLPGEKPLAANVGINHLVHEESSLVAKQDAGVAERAKGRCQ